MHPQGRRIATGRSRDMSAQRRLRTAVGARGATRSERSGDGRRVDAGSAGAAWDRRSGAQRARTSAACSRERAANGTLSCTLHAVQLGASEVATRGAHPRDAALALREKSQSAVAAQDMFVQLMRLMPTSLTHSR